MTAQCRWCGRFMALEETEWVEENVATMPEYPYEIEMFAEHRRGCPASDQGAALMQPPTVPGPESEDAE